LLIVVHRSSVFYNELHRASESLEINPFLAVVCLKRDWRYTLIESKLY
jgi:hypothetical protein